MGKLNEVTSSVFLILKIFVFYSCYLLMISASFSFLRTDNKLLSQEKFNTKGGSF